VSQSAPHPYPAALISSLEAIAARELRFAWVSLVVLSTSRLPSV
jgi:hypothetical protein